ncbi:hypothetical protein BSKO_11030 [Bryopsis sp. KO-2023]|nr:hypothetical protein BSKO_11030 [Bryopsis sp. KO-2023]
MKHVGKAKATSESEVIRASYPSQVFSECGSPSRILPGDVVDLIFFAYCLLNQQPLVKKLEFQLARLKTGYTLMKTSVRLNHLCRQERRLWQDELLDATNTIAMLCNELAIAQASRDSLIKDKKALESAVLENTHQQPFADQLQLTSDPAPEKKAARGDENPARGRKKHTRARRKYEIVNKPECLRALVDAKLQIGKLKEEIILERANVGLRERACNHENRSANFLWDFVSNIFTGAANQQGHTGIEMSVRESSGSQHKM